MTAETLTGNCRFRSTVTGKMVLQVECKMFCHLLEDFAVYWRDAKLTDFNANEFAKRFETTN